MEPYKPQLNFEYPSKLDQSMLKIKVLRNTIVDEHYPFLNKSLGFRFMQGLVYLGIVLPAYIIIKIRLGLQIEGRENFRKNRKLLKNGAMTVSNHIHRWDFLCVHKAVRGRFIYFPAWKGNLDGPDGPVIRFAGGIPIPDNIHAMKSFNNAFDELRAKKKWIHVYPEGSAFFYFQPIRPFKKGVFSMAYRYNLPIIPMAFSYRKPAFPYTLVNVFRFIRKKQKFPMLTLRVGEPLFFDPKLSRKEAIQQMRKECHEAIVRLAGISDNPFPAEGD